MLGSGHVSQRRALENSTDRASSSSRERRSVCGGFAVWREKCEEERAQKEQFVKGWFQVAGPRTVQPVNALEKCQQLFSDESIIIFEIKR